jgi:hypothetical protein
MATSTCGLSRERAGQTLSDRRDRLAGYGHHRLGELTGESRSQPDATVRQLRELTPAICLEATAAAP